MDHVDGSAKEAKGTSNSKSIFQSAVFVYCLLPPLILCYLYLLFRLLATTADCYFSPALETFSFEMGLPPRFAGVVSYIELEPCVYRYYVSVILSLEYVAMCLSALYHLRL